MKKFADIETVSLKDHPEVDEKWLHTAIANNPKILGLGDVEVRAREKALPGGGRLDLLLVDNNDGKRYEMEIQLGATNPSHIIRTIEYWDLERKRYPQYEHCAVIVAEDITSRFFNVIGLFNRHIPIIALKLTAIKQGDEIGLVFVRVLDEILLDEEDEPTQEADESYWHNRVGKDSVMLAKHICASFGVKPYYTRQYAGFVFSNGKQTAKIKIHPKQQWVDLRFVMSQKEQADAIAAESLDYRRASYWFRFSSKNAFDKNAENMKKMYHLTIGQESGDASSTAAESDSD